MPRGVVDSLKAKRLLRDRGALAYARTAEPVTAAGVQTGSDRRLVYSNKENWTYDAEFPLPRINSLEPYPRRRSYRSRTYSKREERDRVDARPVGIMHRLQTWNAEISQDVGSIFYIQRQRETRQRERQRRSRRRRDPQRRWRRQHCRRTLREGFPRGICTSQGWN